MLGAEQYQAAQVGRRYRTLRNADWQVASDIVQRRSEVPDNSGCALE